MATAYPCPNPRCKHVFAREQLQASALTCPACGVTFRFRNPTKAPPPVPVTATEELIVSPATRARRRRGGGFLKGLLVFLLLCGAAGGVLYHYRDDLAEAFDRGGVEEPKALNKQANFSFRASRGWRPNPTIHASIALTRKKPRGHFALYYRDYHTRALSDAELLDQALLRLRATFPQVEYEDPFQGEQNGRTGQLSGEPAIVLAFSATGADSVPIRGQCYMLARRGYAYWLMTWCPEDYQDALADHFERLREGFQLHDEREGWKPTPRPTEAFTGKALAYQLDHAKEVWRKVDDDKGAPTELLLRGFEPTIDDETGKPRVIEYAGKAAEVRVVVLPKAADLAAAVTATHDHVRKRLKEMHPAVKLEPVNDRKTGKTASEVGTFAGQVDSLRLELAPENERFARIAVVRQDEGVLAIVCECRWDRRGYWEEEFTALLKSLRPAAKAPASDDP